MDVNSLGGIAGLRKLPRVLLAMIHHDAFCGSNNCAFEETPAKPAFDNQPL